MRNYRFVFALFLFGVLLIGNKTWAQSPKELLIGSWVKTGITTKEGTELPITFRSKSSYLRFIFSLNGKGYKGITFDDKGLAMNYALQRNRLVFGINTYTIEAIDTVKLVLTEDAREGYQEPAIRYTFTREKNYQNALPVEQEVAIYRRGQPVYKESEKVTAEFLPASSLEEFLDRNMSARHESAKENGFFVASFIILPSGKLDTIQIYKGRNDVYDKQFIKAIKKTDGLWKPTLLGGRAVSIEKEIRFRYFTFATAMDYDNKYSMGIKLKNQKEYETAITFLSACVRLNPYDVEAYYHRAICFKESNQPQNACSDWQQIKSLGSKDADEWLAKFCK